MKACLRDSRGRSTDALLSGLRETGREIIGAQPYMAAVRNSVSTVLLKAESLKRAGAGADSFRRDMLRRLEKFQREHSDMLRGVAEKGAAHIADGDTVVTYSASGSVEVILRKAFESGRRFDVVLSEARPVKEGTKLAGRLARSGISVTLVTDAVLPSYIAGASILLIGADWISATQFANKAGTGVLVETAVSEGVPVYVAAGTDKFCPQQYYPEQPDKHDPAEITRIRERNLTVVNRYFEQVPHDPRIKFITEAGIVSEKDIKKSLIGTISGRI